MRRVTRFWVQKLAVALFLVCLFSAAGTAVYGASGYSLPEVSLEVQLPDGLHVVTRSEISPGLVLEDFGMTQESIDSFFAESNTYLFAFAPDLSYEITISMNEDETSRQLGTFDGQGEELVNLLSAQISLYRQQGIQTSAFEMHKSGQANFVSFDFSYEGDSGSFQGRQTCTVVNGQLIMLVLRSYTGQFDAAQRETFNGIIEGLVFTNLAAPSSAASLPAAGSSRASAPTSEESPFLSALAKVLGAGLSGAVFVGIAFFVKKGKFQKDLSTFVVYKKWFEVETFEYKGKEYDKKQYVSYRAESLKGTSENTLYKWLNEIYKAKEKGTANGLQLADEEAISRALKEKSGTGYNG